MLIECLSVTLPLTEDNLIEQYNVTTKVLSMKESLSTFWRIYETKYSRMDQVKFVEDSL